MKITLSELRQLVRSEVRNSRKNLMESPETGHEPNIDEVVQRYIPGGYLADMWDQLENDFKNAAAGDLSEIGDYYPGWSKEMFRQVVQKVNRAWDRR